MFQTRIQQQTNLHCTLAPQGAQQTDACATHTYTQLGRKLLLCSSTSARNPRTTRAQPAHSPRTALSIQKNTSVFCLIQCTSIGHNHSKQMNFIKHANRATPCQKQCKCKCKCMQLQTMQYLSKIGMQQRESNKIIDCCNFQSKKPPQHHKCQLNRHPTCWCHAVQLGKMLTLAASQHSAQLQVDCDSTLGMLASKIHTSQEALTRILYFTHSCNNRTSTRSKHARGAHKPLFNLATISPHNTHFFISSSCGSSSVSGSWHCSSVSSGQRSTSGPQQDNPQHQIRIKGCL